MSKKIIRAAKRANDSLYHSGVTVDGFLEKKKMFTLDPSVAKEQIYDVTNGGVMKVVNVAEEPEFTSLSLYFMNQAAMCYPGLADSIIKEHINFDQMSLAATAISNVGYICKSRLHYLILNAMYAAKADLLGGALEIPYVYAEINGQISSAEKDRFDKAYESFNKEINNLFARVTNSLCGYLLESISVEELNDDDMIIYNCVTEAVAVLSGGFYDCASVLLSDNFAELFYPYECSATKTMITLHNNLICAAKQFIDELNNSGNRKCVFDIEPLNDALLYPALADAFADSHDVYYHINKARRSEEE